jgi:hypothetical protein
VIYVNRYRYHLLEAVGMLKIAKEGKNAIFRRKFRLKVAFLPVPA